MPTNDQGSGTNATKNGTNSSFLFGLENADVPSGITGFTCRALELRVEPEVYVTATDSDGAVEAIALSNTSSRKKMGTFTGYITSAFDGAAVAATGTISFKGDDYYVKSVSKPLRKGEFAEVSIEAEFYEGLQ